MSDPIVTGKEFDYVVTYGADRDGQIAFFFDRILNGTAEDCPEMYDVNSEQELIALMSGLGVSDADSAKHGASLWQEATGWLAQGRPKPDERP